MLICETEMKIAIQGQLASYHHLAAEKFFLSKINLICCDTFKEVFKTLSDNKADMAVIAIENSLYGTINPVYDLLLKNRFWISGEVYLRVEHCLIGLPGANVKKIDEIYSQIMALAQCENYLDSNFGEAKHIEHHDTVASVEYIKNQGDITKAAIASKQAAERFDLVVLDKNIEDNKQNFTRFVVLSKQKLAGKNNKTSLVLKTSHKPGALYEALGVFKSCGINLSKLQSRPVVGQAWRYMFYIDVESGIESPTMQKCLQDLSDQDCETIILGSYKAGKKLD